MAGTRDDETRGSARADACANCGTTLSDDQRYCLACGARRGPLPTAIATQMAALLRRDRGAEKASAAEVEPDPDGFANWMPTPRAAATAVMCMLALGVILGSVTSHVAQSAGMQSILLQVPAAQPPPAEPVETVEAAPEPVASVPAEISSEVAPAPVPEEEALPEAPVEEAPLEEFDPEAGGLPEVKHVFMIVLGENSFEEAFGEASPAPYLAQTLPEQGGLLSNYYAVAQGDLANQVALISGQGPTPETAANCPNYSDVLPATVSAEGQVEGNGCVYPAATESLPSQLTAADLEWKAYVEDIGNAPGQPTSCRHPALGTPDLKRTAVPGDAYVTWRNPFVYFHSIVDGPECAERNVGLDQLATDLGEAEKTPTLSYIVPNSCHDGGLTPCEPGQVAAGPLEAEAFLRTVVPQILASPAYEDGGLIAITSTQAQQAGVAPDASACCVYPIYPNLPPAPVVESITGPTKPSGGGGRVGLLLISPFIEPGSVNEGYFNHFTLLLTIEELLGLEKLGYAKELALTAFDTSVFNAEQEPLPTTAPPAPAFGPG
ncbi:MAG TPA: alkaline phosphatase family protein [Solirubrobacterales bacterium]|nr:alkaline phosphatase family protein [Solirubrobacterales bacterium]